MIQDSHPKFHVSRFTFHSIVLVRRGQSMLLMVLVLTGTLLSIAMISGLVMLFQIRQSGDFTNSAKAIFAAETGAEWWRYDVKKQSGTGLPISSSTINAALKADNDSSFEIFSVTGNPNQVKVVGTSGNSKRAVLVTMQIQKGLLTCSNEQQVDLIVIFDRPSVQANTNLAKSAGLAFVDKIMAGSTAKVHIGVSHVSASNNVATQLTGSKAIVDGAVSALSNSSGQFALHLAIDNAVSQLNGSLDRTDADYPDAILIITDSPPSNLGQAAAEATTAKNSTNKIKIYVANIGTANDSAFLNGLSSGSDYYFESADFSSLERTLTEDLLGCPPPPSGMCSANLPPIVDMPPSQTLFICPNEEMVLPFIVTDDKDPVSSLNCGGDGLGATRFNVATGQWEWYFVPTDTGQVNITMTCRDSCNAAGVDGGSYPLIRDPNRCP